MLTDASSPFPHNFAQPSMLISAADGTEGNPVVAFLFIAAAIMGSLPGLLSAFEKNAPAPAAPAAEPAKKKKTKLF
jgi:hypothetical protein